MAAAVADSDVVIDYLRGRETTPGLLETLATAGELRITTVSRFEVLSGLSPGRTRDRFLQLLADTPTLDFDAPAADRAAEIDQELRAAGIRLDVADTMIAGIALSHGLPLLTRNRRHFDRIPGLVLIEP